MSGAVEEYTLAMDVDPVLLVSRVNEMIERGWQPVGAVAVSAVVVDTGVKIQYTQTLVKYREF